MSALCLDGMSLYSSFIREVILPSSCYAGLLAVRHLAWVFFSFLLVPLDLPIKKFHQLDIRLRESLEIEGYFSPFYLDRDLQQHRRRPDSEICCQ